MSHAGGRVMKRTVLDHTPGGVAGQPASRSVVGHLIFGTRVKRDMATSLAVLNPAWLCVIAALALSLIGVYTIDLASGGFSAGFSGADAGLSAVAWKQVVFLLIGLLAATVVALPHYKWLSWISLPAFVGCIGLLVFLMIPFVPSSIVTPRNGARAWIDLGPVDLQPSELTKIAYVLVIAHYMRYRSSHRELKGLLIPGLITAVPVGLITLQPDLGTSALFVPSLFAMLVAAGARLRHLTLIVLAAGLAAPAVYPVLKPHQKSRIIALVRQYQGDTASAQDINFQSYTAQNLIGAGGADGLDPEKSRALVTFNRLPERHNDTIFAVVVNRFGFLGGVGVLALTGLWVAGALASSAACRTPQGRLICVGFAAFVATQMVVNVGMNIGLLPIIGITLPFVSYGGSSLLTVWLMTGLIMNVALHRDTKPYRRSFEYADGHEAATGSSIGVNAGFSGRAITR
jgi:cell division protein FtsW (lipid II flippase)